ncbi:hypothetical protein N7470_006929 [Penicillium chermesinum]|nr:hypothetical protein N7470_006929 [Penicillium chermesinum]
MGHVASITHPTPLLPEEPWTMGLTANLQSKLVELAKEVPPWAATPPSDEYPSNHRSSSESFDMLPGTPPESVSGSPPGSPTMHRHLSVMKVHRNTTHEDSPPQYEPIADTQQAPNTINHQPSRNNLRPMNLGVPSRKPVPGSSNQPTPNR